MIKNRTVKLIYQTIYVILSFVSVAPLIIFIGMLSILLTFLVFYIMLAGAEGPDPQAN